MCLILCIGYCHPSTTPLSSNRAVHYLCWSQHSYGYILSPLSGILLCAATDLFDPTTLFFIICCTLYRLRLILAPQCISSLSQVPYKSCCNTRSGSNPASASAMYLCTSSPSLNEFQLALHKVQNISSLLMCVVTGHK